MQGTARIESGAAVRARVDREISGDGHLGVAHPTQNGWLVETRDRPHGWLVSRSGMTLKTRVVLVAARETHGDDIQNTRPMDAPGLIVDDSSEYAH